MDVGIGQAEVRDRIDRLRRSASTRGLQGVLVVSRAFYDRPGNVAYFSNHFPPFPAGLFWGEARGLGHAAIVIPPAGEPILFHDRTVRQDIVAIADTRRVDNFARAIAGGLQEKSLARARIGLVGDDIMPLAMYRELSTALPDLVLEPADDLAVQIRLQKSAAELALLGRAAGVCGDGYAAALPAIRDGASERAVCAAGIAGCIAAGADFVRYFRTNSGPDSALGARWPQATDRIMHDGELVCLDMIGAYWGHQFDVLRTTVVGRRPADRQRHMLETALAATRAAIAAVRPGVRTRVLVTAAHRVLEEAGLGAYARPMIGHGIGYETIEAPLITASEETILRPGMVLCIEPSIYVPKVGGACVEEEIVVTEDGAEVLTTLEARLWE